MNYTAPSIFMLQPTPRPRRRVPLDSASVPRGRFTSELLRHVTPAGAFTLSTFCLQT